MSRQSEITISVSDPAKCNDKFGQVYIRFDYFFITTVFSDLIIVVTKSLPLPIVPVLLPVQSLW